MRTLLAVLSMSIMGCSGGGGSDVLGPEPDARPPDGSSSAPVATPTTIGTATAGHLAVTTGCIVVASGTTLTCVSAGQPNRTLATLPAPVVSVLGAGDLLVASTTAASNANALDVIYPDGAVTELAALTRPNATAVGLALGTSGDVVFTTASDAELESVSLSGGSPTLHASDSGNFGDVIVLGTTAYYANATSIYARDLSAPGASDSSNAVRVAAGDFVDPVLAPTGPDSWLAAGTSLDGSITNFVTFPVAGTVIAPLRGRVGRIAGTQGHAYVIAGGDLTMVDVPTGYQTPIAVGEQVVDVYATGSGVLWLDQDGRVRYLEQSL